MRALILLITLLAAVAAYGDSTRLVELRRQQAELISQYEMLDQHILGPAGAQAAFTSFRTRNPHYYRDNFSRARTALAIRQLLPAGSPGREAFEKCGLNRADEYYCQDGTCAIHGEYLRRRSPEMSRSFETVPLNILLLLASAIGGLIVFVLVTGLGRGICAWLDRKFPGRDDTDSGQS